MLLRRKIGVILDHSLAHTLISKIKTQKINKLMQNLVEMVPRRRLEPTIRLLAPEGPTNSATWHNLIRIVVTIRFGREHSCNYWCQTFLRSPVRIAKPMPARKTPE